MNIRSLCRNVAVVFAAVLTSCSSSPPAQTGPASSANPAREVRSPDGKIAIAIHTDAPLGYSITVDGKPAAGAVPPGLELAGNVNWVRNPWCKARSGRSADTHWVNQFGKNRDVRDHYNELNLTLKDGDRTFGVVARAYDDGVAFRLVLPKQPGMDSFTVMRDATEYTFTDDNPVWAGWNNGEGAARPEGGFIGSQEWRYLPNKLSGLNPKFKHGLPFLVQTPAAYVAITESDLLDWSAMWLVPKAGAKFTLETQLAPPIPARPWVNGAPAANGAAVSTAAAPTGEVQKGLVVARTPHNSPWRTFIIGRQPADLISSDLVSEPRHPEPDCRHLLDQAGHVVLGHLVAQRGEKRPSHPQGVHPTRRRHGLALSVVGNRRQIHRPRLGGLRQGTRRENLVVVPLQRFY